MAYLTHLTQACAIQSWRRKFQLLPKPGFEGEVTKEGWYCYILGSPATFLSLFVLLDLYPFTALGIPRIASFCLSLHRFCASISIATPPHQQHQHIATTTMHRPTSILIPFALLTGVHSAIIPRQENNGVATVTVTSGVTTVTESVTAYTIAPYVAPETKTVTDGIETSTVAVVVIPSGVETETVAVVQSSSGVVTSTVPVVVVPSGEETSTVQVTATPTPTAQQGGQEGGVVTETVSVTATVAPSSAEETDTALPIDTASASSQVSSIQSSLLSELTEATSTQEASTVTASTITSIPSITSTITASEISPISTATAIIGGDVTSASSALSSGRSAAASVIGSVTGSVTTQLEEEPTSTLASTETRTQTEAISATATETGSVEEQEPASTVFGGTSPTSTLPPRMIVCPTGVDRGLNTVEWDADYVCSVTTTSTAACEGGVCTATSTATATATGSATTFATVAPGGGNATATGVAPPAFTGAASQLKAGGAIAAGLAGAFFAMF